MRNSVVQKSFFVKKNNVLSSFQDILYGNVSSLRIKHFKELFNICPPSPFVSVPDAPVGIQVHSINPTVIKVLWDPIKHHPKHGKFLGYKVYYRQMGTNNWFFVSCDCTNFSLRKLKTNVKYRIRVFAYTTNGHGIPSQAYEIVTGQGWYSQFRGRNKGGGGGAQGVRVSPPPKKSKRKAQNYNLFIKPMWKTTVKRPAQSVMSCNKV